MKNFRLPSFKIGDFVKVDCFFFPSPIVLTLKNWCFSMPRGDVSGHGKILHIWPPNLVVFVLIRCDIVCDIKMNIFYLDSAACKIPTKVANSRLLMHRM